MHEFETIEDGVLAALAGLKTSGMVRTLEPYAGELNEASLMTMTVLFPCIYVLCQGMDIAWSGNVSEQTVAVSLMVGTRNLRGPTAASRGDASPGAYDILEAARAILHRKVIIAGWSVMRATREVVMGYIPEVGICVCEATYEVRRKAL